MMKFKNAKRGFTLIELLIVLAVIAILGAIVVPNMQGFISRGKENAFKADLRILQAATNAHRTDVGTNVGDPWPIIGSAIGTPAEGGTSGWQCDGSDATEVCSWLDIGSLSTDTYIDGADIVSSADTSVNSTATNSPAGSYGWYVSTDGSVTSSPAFSLSVGYP